MPPVDYAVSMPSCPTHLGRQHGNHVGQRGARTDLAGGVPLLHDAHLDTQHALQPNYHWQTSRKEAF